jgi:predicted AAA+ superfamily ATPase
LISPQAFPGQIDAVCVVNEAIEDGVGVCWIADDLMPGRYRKLMTGSELRLTPYHFRDQKMREVDIVLERDDGMIVGIEVKASATVMAGNFSGLRTLAEACGGRFAYGVVLYDSGDLVPFGDRLAAAPLSSLWA